MPLWSVCIFLSNVYNWENIQSFLCEVKCFLSNAGKNGAACNYSRNKLTYIFNSVSDVKDCFFNVYHLLRWCFIKTSFAFKNPVFFEFSIKLFSLSIMLRIFYSQFDKTLLAGNHAEISSLFSFLIIVSHICLIHNKTKCILLNESKK